MPFNNNLIRVVYLLTFLAQTLTLWAVVHKKLRGQLPWFATFLVFVSIDTIAVYVLYELASAAGLAEKDRYIYTAWILEGVAQLLVVCFLSEIMRDALSQYASVRKIATRILVTLGLAFIVVAIVTTPFADAPHPVTRLFNVVVRSVRLFQVGLVVTFFALARYLALSFRNYQFGILLGFGLYAASDLANAALVAHYGGIVAYKAMLIDAFSYIGMFVIWLYYILKTEPEPPTTGPKMGPDDLDAWKKTLDGIAR